MDGDINVLGIILCVVIIAFILVTIAKCVRIVPQASCWITEFFGKYKSTWNSGLHLKIPFFEKVVNKVSLKERTLDFQPQRVITKDNVTMAIDSVVFMQVLDAKLFTYGIDNPMYAIENLAATTLRNIVGEMDFDQTLSSRDAINTKMITFLDQATDPWGIKITRVEIKNIQPPAEIQEVMTKQMRAEREKRQAILEAEAHQESVIKRAQGDKEAKVLAAEAERDARIAMAEGQAKSIQLVYEAEAAGLARLNEVRVDASVLKLKSLDALKNVADGNSTKIFIPSDLTNILAGLGVAGEVLGVGDSTDIKKKPLPKKPVVQDDCIERHESEISHDAAMTGAVINNQLEHGINPANSQNGLRPR